MRVLTHDGVNITTHATAVPTIRRAAAIAVVGALFGALYGIALGGALSLMFGNPWKILFIGGSCALIGPAACLMFALVGRMNGTQSDPVSSEGSDDARHDDPSWTEALLVPQGMRYRELRHRFVSTSFRVRRQTGRGHRVPVSHAGL